MKTPWSRRDFLKTSALAASASLTAPLWRSRARAADLPPPAGSRAIASGPFAPTWDSLRQNYQVPTWFRDAKFGIWAHWSAQCVPEQGDWYARKMYLQGEPDYDYHVKTYGHPSKFGFMEIDHLWKADQWEPEKLMGLYQRAGAKYFFGLANHHDNFDTYDSKYHAWNSVNVGPKQDIIGRWQQAARAHGLRFGVSNHSSHAWRWLMPAYGYDGEGPLAGVRYDAATLTKADGMGTWWQGLDPRELYTGPNIVIPDGIIGAAAVRAWHQQHDMPGADPSPGSPFVENWFRRCQDLVDKYAPDVVYFDTNELPLGQVGLDLVAHYYNMSAARNGGRADVVVNGKHIKPGHVGAFVEDIERGIARGIRPDPWQTDTCIGQWHYSRALAEANKYKTVDEVVDMLLDIVSKNGNLMLSIPLRGNGTIDEHEHAFLTGLAAWMDVNAEGIFGSRPWKIHGEGPALVNAAANGHYGGAPDVGVRYTSADIRFMVKGDLLYAYLLAVPGAPHALITSLSTVSPHAVGRKPTEVSLLGYNAPLEWKQDEHGLTVKLPENLPSAHALALRIRGIA